MSLSNLLNLTLILNLTMVKELKKVSVDLKQYTDNVFKKVLTLKLFAI